MFPGYLSFACKRQGNNCGGIATSVKVTDSAYTMKIKEGSQDNEMLVTRHDKFATPINIINVYGEVEGRASKDIIESHWSDILEEIARM